MTLSFKRIVLCASLALLGAAAQAQQDAPAAASSGIAAKLIVRGELQGLQAVDLRAQRRNDVLVVQAEIMNMDTRDLRLYYRFRWLDANGFQVGDGEVWKPLVFLGKQSQFIKGTAYGPQATDFKIEMSSEPR
ncbi:YcfL family protein [Noviherbaspirillum sp. ST9]|uniref:YcfL family protein n=1 Tax=Noviherbaspirillum sp. ST9 TaxID=3401606 RepID=UPI003B5885FF